MIRFILPIILIAISVTGFLTFTQPLYQDISLLRTDVSAYNEALNNSKALESERDKLTAKYNSISKEDIDRLQKLVPDNIDNIRLILEIEKIASPYGMGLKDVKFNATEAGSSGDDAKTATASRRGTEEDLKDYRVLEMEFSTTGSYKNFLSLLRDLESNLRIIDISSIVFSSDADVKTGAYKYSLKIKTYWLKS